VSIDWFPTDASVQSASGKRRLAAAFLSQMTAPMILATLFGADGTRHGGVWRNQAIALRPLVSVLHRCSRPPPRSGRGWMKTPDCRNPCPLL